MINLVLLGPPASGKGTQAAKLIEKLGLCHIAAGDLLRAEVKAGTTLGHEIKDVIERGDLLPADIVVGLIARRIEQPDCQNGVLFDGFPRSVVQAQGLDDILSAKGQSVTLAIELQADESMLLNRMQKRIDSAIAQGQQPRNDDNINTLKHRLHIYNHETMQVVPYYQAQGKHEPIIAWGSADQVADSINIVIAAHGLVPVAAVQKSFVPPSPSGEPQP